MGIGKSTLIDIIDFCLGGSTRKKKEQKGLPVDPLKNWSFTIDITLTGNRVKVTRAIATPNRIVIKGPTTGWIEQPPIDVATGEQFLKLEHWKIILGYSLFRLPQSVEHLKYKPTYRSLISYFIRKGHDAYGDPFRYFRQQKTWNIQLHVAYLLGLNWEYASQWQELKDQDTGIKGIEKAIKTGVMKSTVGSIGELETQRIQLEQEADTAERALKSFKVHPQYESIQSKADSITSELHELANQNIVERQKLTRYQNSITEEKPPQPLALESIYKESGFIFPETLKKTLSQAREFHENIVANRHEFLLNEINRVKQSIKEREVRIKQLTESRAGVMEVLETHGALQEMVKLQEHHVALKAKLERILLSIDEIKALKEQKRKLKLSKAELLAAAEQDHEQRRDVWSEAVRLFNKHSQALYKSPGKLIIDIARTGFKYQVEIERGSSEGIDKMKIFCLDSAFIQLQLQNPGQIDFLIHDSLLYDAVDPRQRAKALEQAEQVTSKIGAQYICTINSDMVPRSDFSKKFNFDQYVRLTLTDTTPAGSLLGIRF